MEEIQNELLDKYMQLNGNPVLRKIVADTGIQLTRIFRLFNGAEMKLGEYLIFQAKVNEYVKGESIQNLGEKCDRVLSEEVKKEVIYELNKKIKMQKLNIKPKKLKLVA
jgi:hypothetical protein